MSADARDALRMRHLRLQQRCHDAEAHVERLITEAQSLYEALLWVSEYPNRETIWTEADGLVLAEYAREALNDYEAKRGA